MYITIYIAMKGVNQVYNALERNSFINENVRMFWGSDEYIIIKYLEYIYFYIKFRVKNFFIN